jgi:hypothetical protein
MHVEHIFVAVVVFFNIIIITYSDSNNDKNNSRFYSRFIISYNDSMQPAGAQTTL